MKPEIRIRKGKQKIETTEPVAVPEPTPAPQAISVTVASPVKSSSKDEVKPAFSLGEDVSFCHFAPFDANRIAGHGTVMALHFIHGKYYYSLSNITGRIGEDHMKHRGI